jgi:hypothetical protein
MQTRVDPLGMISRLFPTFPLAFVRQQPEIMHTPEFGSPRGEAS